MELLELCRTIISRFEGFRSKPYLDVKGVPTIGYGSTYYQDGTKVTIDDDSISQPDAQSLLDQVIQTTIDHVQKLVTFEVNDNQTAALTSFAYNLGVTALANSTLLKKLNAGDIQGAAAQFNVWVHAGPKVIPDLVKRRQQEKALFLS